MQEDNENEIYSKTTDRGELLPKTERQEENFKKTGTIKDATPFVEESTGAWILNEYDVECIAIGAGILGCGGGGNPYLAKLRAGLTLKSGKEIRVIHPDRYAIFINNMCVISRLKFSDSENSQSGH